MKRRIRMEENGGSRAFYMYVGTGVGQSDELIELIMWANGKQRIFRSNKGRKKKSGRVCN